MTEGHEVCRSSRERPGANRGIDEHHRGERCVQPLLKEGDEQKHYRRLHGDDERLDIGGEGVVIGEGVHVREAVGRQLEPPSRQHQAAGVALLPKAQCDGCIEQQ